MRKRAGALIIKDKKLLLVTGRRKIDNEPIFYWTPGGGLEDGEKYEQALSRELLEELDVIVTNMQPYGAYVSHNSEVISKHVVIPPSDERYYLVDIEGYIKLNREVAKIVWVNKSELSSITITSAFRKNIISKLIADNLI